MITRVLALAALVSRPLAIQAFNPTLSFASSPFQTAVRMSSTSTEMKKRVLVPIAEDSEEIETSCITDVLTRFGAEVVVASVMPDNLVCKMSRGLKVCADVHIEEAANEDWDLISLPGGMPGAEHLRNCSTLIQMLKKQQQAGKPYGAVCASPAVVLQTHGLITAPGATCYPAPPFRATMDSPTDESVSVQDNVVTSQGPGTSLLFALALGEKLYGKEAADKIAAELLVSRT
ncbi:DJ-1 family protein [Chaetoceros tenuissimus]|uniref:DJ-1 family protein n=1 Tax=Chaetoceros tenuissimus TaxID=426638 RepID=A0AAD3DA93_9STRA|nr:DJ-1 family protein [Chaetoceros tenuissimus]